MDLVLQRENALFGSAVNGASGAAFVAATPSSQEGGHGASPRSERMLKVGWAGEGGSARLLPSAATGEDSHYARFGFEPVHSAQCDGTAGEFRAQNVRDAAVVVLENRTGEVMGLVGSENYFAPGSGW